MNLENYFDQLYRINPDPWNHEQSLYEQRKYALTLNALPQPRYACAIELGCGNGLLAARLSRRADRLIAIDLSLEAIRLAQARHGGDPAVTFIHGVLPRDWPRDRYDLVVVSEVLYYLNPETIAELARHIGDDLVKGGTCLAVNWLGANDMPLTGRSAAEIFSESLLRNPQFGVSYQHSNEHFRLDCFEKALI